MSRVLLFLILDKDQVERSNSNTSASITSSQGQKAKYLKVFKKKNYSEDYNYDFQRKII